MYYVQYSTQYIKTPVWVSHATRTDRQAAPFTDLPHAMAIDNLAPPKRSRNPLTTNETVRESTAAARALQTLPTDYIDDKSLPHKTGDSNSEPITLRRLMFCVVQRCLRVLSGARHQQPREGMGSDPAVSKKADLRKQSDMCLHSKHINSLNKRSLRPARTPPESLGDSPSRSPTPTQPFVTQPAREPFLQTPKQGPSSWPTEDHTQPTTT
eukprot:scaffold16628_cov124-Isochrysis_galbana.AAC.1